MFIKEYKLRQHSIMIHFQAGHEENGLNVCLRASEVKPKFDRFLVKKLGGREKVLSEYGQWVRAKNDNKVDLSLNYRMTIKCSSKKITKYTSGRNEEFKLPDMYYGNMNQKKADWTDDTMRYGVFFNDGLIVRIICFDDSLEEEIDKYIAAFFVVTNFGTMQDKGFGSFTIENAQIHICDTLSKNFDIETCYVVETKQEGYSSRAQNELFDTIKQIYSVMKSGQNFVGRDGRTITNKYIRSFIYQYMHKTHHLGNEKAWLKKRLKKQEIVPIRTTHEPQDTHEHHQQKDLQEFRYVRALLGIGEQMEWIESEDEQRSDRPRREKITIEDTTKTGAIERYASPVFFKIIGNRIYITAKQPDWRIFGHKFKFTNQGYTKEKNNKSPRKGRSDYISTLTAAEESEFDMADFLNEFMLYYNNNYDKGKLRKRYRMEAGR